MRNLIDSNQSYTGLVQKYIGSAYDVVYAVYLALEDIKKIGGIIGTPEWEDLIKLAPDFEELLKRLALFSDVFYGALPDEPTERPSGDPTQDGDLYYDTIRMGLFMYEGGAWVRLGAYQNQLEVIKVEAAHIQGDNIVLPLKYSYHPNTNSILVFVNATYQYPITAGTPDGAYIEKDTKTLVFPYNPNHQGTLQPGDTVTVMVGGTVTNVEHQLSVRTEVHVVTLPSQQKFRVDTGYAVSHNNIEVFVDGIRQVRGAQYDYQALDGEHVEFNHHVPQNAVVVFKVGDIIGNTGDSSKNNLQVLDNVGQFFHRGVSLDNTRPVMTLGQYVAGDGGQGLWVWQDLPVDIANGGTVIDAQVALDAQGTGTPTRTGVWVRDYAREVKFQWFGVDEELVANLNQITSAKDGDTVYITGYNAVGDGADGWFVWDGSRPKADHDGGIVIDPNQTFPQQWNMAPEMTRWYQGTNTGTGCWVRMHPENANLFWWGAVGDGVTDNSLVFQNLATAFKNNELKRLEIPAGVFLLDSQGAVFDQLQNVTFWANGHQAQIRLGPNCVAQPLQFNDCRSMTFENFVLREARTTNHGTGLYFRGGTKLDFNNLNFWEFHKHALLGEPINPGDNCFGNTQVKNCVFSECPADEDHLVQFEPGKTVNRCVYENNRFENCGTSANSPALMLVGLGFHGAVARNNFFRLCKGPGMLVTAYEEVQVQNNHFTEQVGTSIHVNPVPDGLGITGQSLNQALILNNVFDNRGNNMAPGILVDAGAPANSVLTDGNYGVGNTVVMDPASTGFTDVTHVTVPPIPPVYTPPMSATIPTNPGTAGDVVYNSAPASGGTVGWVYTTAGTWAPFGAIS